MTSCCSGRRGRSARRRSTSFGPTRTASASSRSPPAAATRRCWPSRRWSSPSPSWPSHAVRRSRTCSSRCMPRRSSAAITTATSSCRGSSADPTRPSSAPGCRATSCSTRSTAPRGSRPPWSRSQAGATLALANKESLIIGGDLVTSLAKPGQIVPVDSEHSALAQCLRGGRADEVRKLVITASGGPFRGRTRAELADGDPRARRWHTRPGTWGRWSRSTPRPSSTRGSR